MDTLTLVLALHNHQPVGNFGWVNRDAADRAYLPFLRVMEDYPDLPYALHVSGSLLEWAENEAPDYLEALRRALDGGVVELLGGGRFEPIFSALSERDRLGQVRSFADHIEETFGVRPCGVWLPERVFEQGLVSSLARAGARYTVVDDYHFHRAGLDDVHRLFVTEDQGRTLHLFASSEPLRYRIPFAPAEEVIAWLRRAAREKPGALVVYADDGEKFGVWPGTHRHVYEDGWLRRFLDLLRENRDWLELATFSSVIGSDRPASLVFLPDSSYREMVEWAMPARALADYRALETDLEAAGLLQRTRRFLGGGFWRNFRVKYPEVNRLYGRMTEVSEEVHRLPPAEPGREEALLDLYRGQVNCVYWHGVFGGLYLPHLRRAAYHHLLGAEAAVRRARAPAAPAVQARSFDFDFDGRPEVSVDNGLLKAYLAPHRGGGLFELDVLEKQYNLLMTLTRRPEDYHALVGRRTDQEAVASIHDVRRSKQEGMAEKIAYDRHERQSLVDHFFGPGLTVDALLDASYIEEGDFVGRPYRLEMAAGPRCADIHLFRKGTLARDGRAVGLRLVKKLHLAEGERALVVRYALRAEEDVEVRFGPECNLCLLAGDTPDRACFGRDGARLGPPALSACLEARDFLGLRDEWMGLEVRFELSEPADLFVHPVETVSQSEAGFELLYQQTCLTPVFRLPLRAGERREVEIRWEVTCRGGPPAA